MKVFGTTNLRMPSKHNQVVTFICNFIFVLVCVYLCQITEIRTPAIVSNTLAIQNPSAVRYVYNEPEPEEIELHAVKEVNNKSNDHGVDLERTNGNGAKVELSDNEPRSSDMTTGDGPRPCVLAWT